MAELPADAQGHFDRAARNLNEAGRRPAVDDQLVANATGAAAMANVDVAEGLAHALLEAEEKLTASLDRFVGAIDSSTKASQDAVKAAAEASNAASRELAQWTKTLGWATIALAIFTLVQAAVGVLQYFK